MKKAICVALAVLCLLAAMETGFAAAAGAEDVSIFAFVNQYEEPVTPPDMSEADLRALVNAQSETLETEYAVYSAVQSVFDGCTGYLMVKVTPKEPEKILLMSDYMWAAEDWMPLTDEPDSRATFAELAGERQIVVAGLTLNDQLGGELTDDASFSEMYFSDGTMLLFARFNYNEISDAARDLAFTVREYPYGGAGEVYKLTVRLTPTIPLETVFAQGTYTFDGITVTDAVLMRSPLGMVLRLNGFLDAELDDDRLEALRGGVFELDENDSLFLAGDGILFCDENGVSKYPEEAKPGDRVRSELTLRAGEKCPERLTVRLNTFSKGDMPENTLEFAASQAE